MPAATRADEQDSESRGSGDGGADGRGAAHAIAQLLLAPTSDHRSACPAKLFELWTRVSLLPAWQPNQNRSNAAAPRQRKDATSSRSRAPASAGSRQRAPSRIEV